MRGEHATGHHDGGVGHGSSPHARGTRILAAVELSPERLIPACAGNTRRSSTDGRSAPAHPRMRGEHFNGNEEAAWYVGSSPHARGTLALYAASVAGQRLIPACAGNTHSVSPPAMRNTAHPRMRGEHGRERGRCLARRRLIPACAGNTPGCRGRHGTAPAHPRMRGEHFPERADRCSCDGSSPHARGTQELCVYEKGKQRLIPACAGNTCPRPAARSANPAHPRMRGEHSSMPSATQRKTGSSPHARGTLCTLRPVAYQVPAHPRMRGEHHRDHHDRADDLRLIPACAGNTT